MQENSKFRDITALEVTEDGSVMSEISIVVQQATISSRKAYNNFDIDQW